MQNLADAFADLVQEVRKGGDVAALAAEIGPDYGVNPALLVRKFAEVYPAGLGEIDPQADEKAAALRRKQEADRDLEIMAYNEKVREHNRVVRAHNKRVRAERTRRFAEFLRNDPIMADIFRAPPLR